jgi:hypothetical protein
MPIKQYITSKNIIKNNGDLVDFQDSINVACPFLVKRIRFNFAYAYRLDSLTTIVVSGSVNSYHTAIAAFNGFSRIAGGIVSYARDLENDAATEIVFNDPIQIHEEVRIIFNSVVANALFSGADNGIFCRVECYSE